jgi:hypothetical protein
MSNFLKRFTFFLLVFFLILNSPTVALASFRFVVWSDAQDLGVNLQNTSKKVAVLNPSPAFSIFIGDFEQNGFTQAEMNVTVKGLNGDVSGLTSNGLFGRTFLIRGNRDNNQAGSTTAWSNYLNTAFTAQSLGVQEYTELEPDLTYSFDFENSRFIAVDVPDNINDSVIAWIDDRLTDAEINHQDTLSQAFIFFHIPLYYNNAVYLPFTTVQKFTSMFNRHPLVSATFHGHIHAFSWNHIDSTKISDVTHEFEHLITNPSGDGGSTDGYITVDVNGLSYTVNSWEKGSISSVWTKTFTKSGVPTITPGGSTPTTTPLPVSPMPIKTLTPTVTPGGGTYLNLKIYLHGIGYGGDNVNPSGAGNVSPLHSIRTVTLQLIDTNNQIVLTKQLLMQYVNGMGNIPDFTGLTTISGIQSGLYTAKVSVPQYLIRTMPGILQIRMEPGLANDSPEVRLTTGDTNADNVLSVLDYNMILDCYSDLAPAKNCADANKKLMTDLTDDGSINQFDYNLFLRELSVQSGQ